MPFLGPGILFKYERRRVVLKLCESYARLCRELHLLEYQLNTKKCFCTINTHAILDT